jgi:lysophospholipase L1-like esterase
MHRSFSVLFLAVLLGGLVIGSIWYGTRAPAAEPYRPTGPGDVYVALGDSLAAGYTVSEPQEEFTARIAAAIRQEQPIEVRNFAISGETSRSLLDRQLPEAIHFIEAQQEAGIRVSPITLTIGGNDALRVVDAPLDVRRRTVAAVEANIGTALDQLIAATTDPSSQRTADIAVMNYYNLFPGDPDDQSGPTYWANQFNAAIARAAATRGVAVADVASAFAGGNVYRYTYIATGDIHANPDGHALIAEQFLAALQYDLRR